MAKHIPCTSCGLAMPPGEILESTGPSVPKLRRTLKLALNFEVRVRPNNHRFDLRTFQHHLKI